MMETAEHTRARIGASTTWGNSAIARLLVSGHLGVSELRTAVAKSPSGTISKSPHQDQPESCEPPLDLSFAAKSREKHDDGYGGGGGGGESLVSGKRKHDGVSAVSEARLKCPYCPFVARDSSKLYAHYHYHKHVLSLSVQTAVSDVSGECYRSVAAANSPLAPQAAAPTDTKPAHADAQSPNPSPLTSPARTASDTNSVGGTAGIPTSHEVLSVSSTSTLRTLLQPRHGAIPQQLRDESTVAPPSASKYLKSIVQSIIKQRMPVSGGGPSSRSVLLASSLPPSRASTPAYDHSRSSSRMSSPARPTTSFYTERSTPQAYNNNNNNNYNTTNYNHNICNGSRSSGSSPTNSLPVSPANRRSPSPEVTVIKPTTIVPVYPGQTRALSSVAPQDNDIRSHSMIYDIRPSHDHIIASGGRLATDKHNYHGADDPESDLSTNSYNTMSSATERAPSYNSTSPPGLGTMASLSSPSSPSPHPGRSPQPHITTDQGPSYFSLLHKGKYPSGQNRVVIEPHERYSREHVDSYTTTRLDRPEPVAAEVGQTKGITPDGSTFQVMYPQRQSSPNQEQRDNVPHPPSDVITVPDDVTNPSHGTLEDVVPGQRHLSAVAHDCRQAADSATGEEPSGPGSCRCQHCGITFDDEVIFSIHMGCHNHKDPFLCNVCGRACENKYAFYTHIMRGHEYS